MAAGDGGLHDGSRSWAFPTMSRRFTRVTFDAVTKPQVAWVVGRISWPAFP